jgi:hypothetical protein
MYFGKVHHHFGGTYRLLLQGVRKYSVCLLTAGFLLGLLFDAEDGGSTYLRNVGGRQPKCTVLQPIRFVLFILL